MRELLKETPRPRERFRDFGIGGWSRDLGVQGFQGCRGLGFGV